jgi:hypothetical protein
MRSSESGERQESSISAPLGSVTPKRGRHAIQPVGNLGIHDGTEKSLTKKLQAALEA